MRRIASDEIAQEIERFFASIFPDEIDQRLAWMMEVEQIRETALFAMELNLNHLEDKRQEQEVKRVKDRIKVHLKRKGWADFKEKLRRHD